MRKIATLLLLTTLGLAQPLLAHTDEALDQSASPHGGQVRMAGMYHFELVVKDKQLLVYLTDHGGTAIPSQGVSGSATVLSSGKTTIALKPAGNNLLSGSGDFKIGPDMKVVLSVTFPGNKTEQARFTPVKKK